MERIKLIQAGDGDINKEWEFITSEPSENGLENLDFGCSFLDYQNSILPLLINNSKGLCLKPGYVPQTTYFLTVDGVIVGFFKVRHYLTEVTRHNGAGHIGYGIKKDYRGKGYATKGLALAIKKLIAMPDYRKEENIIMGAHKDNIASLKVQKSNGAEIIEETDTDYITEINVKEYLKKNSVSYRQETPKDYYESEYMTQRAFWNQYFPGCDEHYLVHKLRDHKDYIPELTLVAVHNEKIVGLVMYAHSKIVNDKEEYPCITFGPLAVDPLYQNQGIGRELLKRSFDIARSMGFSRVVILGEPNYYPKLGFNTCDKIGVTTSEGENFPAFMYYELVPGAFDGIKGKYIYSECYHSLHGKEVEEFDKKFPPLEKKVLPGQWGHLQE